MCIFNSLSVGVLGSQKIIECVKNGDPNTLVVSLISGGGSALLCYPSSPLTLEDVQKTTKLLLESGADIIEMNCIRKHLSSIKVFLRPCPSFLGRQLGEGCLSFSCVVPRSL